MKASELRSYIDLNLEGINDAGTYSIQKKLQNNFVNKFVQLHNDHVTGKLLYLDDVKMRLFVSQSVKASITATLPRYYTDEQYVNAVVNFYLNGKISKNQAIEILESFFRNTALRIVIPGDFTLRPGIIDSHEIEIPIRETIERPWRTTID